MSQIIADRYIILEKLGAGGMGTVFKAEDNHTQEQVAVKQLKEGFTDDEMLERFMREGEALRALNHPNIVKMYEAIEEENTHYLIMELVAGGDLASAIKRERLALEDIVDLAIDLADALTRAHRLQIIHRDLKPANMLLGDNRTLKLTDFGIAHIGTKQRITDSLFAVGTIDYMSPEALRGEAVDAHTDIWAFGVILFEMLTGERPFQGATITETMYNILENDIPDLELLAPGAPTALIDLIYRMLERDALVRIPSVRIVGAELEAIQAGRDQQIVSNSLFDEPQAKHVLRQQHNLPAQTTAFVGREDELAELSRLLQDNRQRLITILAPGGMGKTRLALQVAENQLEHFEDGVYFVDLAPLSDPDNIVYTIGNATGFPLMGDLQMAEKELFGFLGNKQMLLVMDNWEHLIEGASLVTGILQSAPDVTILSTSRRRLEQTGEVIFQLSGLEFPKWETPEDALEYSAVRLFMSSAKRVDPSFDLTSDNLDYIARICRLAGGMPLGIVLAASWVGVLSCEEIAEEIANGIEFLESTSNDVPERQRSIQVVFDYSWNLLTPSEQSILMKSSIFKGGFTRQAVQAVTGASLRDLVNLSNKSLLRRDKASGRYSIHELARQFAHSKLEASGEYDRTREAHLRHYEHISVDLTPHFKGGKKQIASFKELETEFDNIRIAWEWAHKLEHWETLANMARAIGLLESYRGRENENFDLFMPVIRQLLDIQTPDKQQAILMTVLGGNFPKVTRFTMTFPEQETIIRRGIEWAELHSQSSDLILCLLRLSEVLRAPLQLAEILSAQEMLDEIATVADEAMKMARDIDDAYLLALSLLRRSYITSFQSDSTVVQQVLDEFYELVYQLDNKILLTFAIRQTSTISQSDEHEKRVSLLNEALDITREIGLTRMLPNQISMLIWTHFQADEFDKARDLLVELEALAVERNSLIDFGLVAYSKGQIAAWHNDFQLAIDLYQEAENLMVRSGYMGYVQFTRRYRGVMNIQLDEIETGLQLIKETAIPKLHNYRRMDYTVMLASLIYIKLQHDKPYQLLELLALFQQHSPILPKQDLYPYIDDAIDDLKSKLDPATFEAAWKRGESLDLFETVDTVLEEYYAHYDIE